MAKRSTHTGRRAAVATTLKYNFITYTKSTAALTMVAVFSEEINLSVEPREVSHTHTILRGLNETMATSQMTSYILSNIPLHRLARGRRNKARNHTGEGRCGSLGVNHICSKTTIDLQIEAQQTLLRRRQQTSWGMAAFSSGRPT